MRRIADFVTDAFVVIFLICLSIIMIAVTIGVVLYVWSGYLV